MHFRSELSLTEDCRVCTDIHSWVDKVKQSAFDYTTTKPQNNEPRPDSGHSNNDSPIDGLSRGRSKANVHSRVPEGSEDAFAAPDAQMPCPPDSLDLGRSTWTFLHTTSVYYPENPTPEDERQMKGLLEGISRFYPCGYCAEHMRQELKDDPPRTQSRSDLAQWMCELHNKVNERLGKPIFPCARVFERWKTGC